MNLHCRSHVVDKSLAKEASGRLTRHIAGKYYLDPLCKFDKLLLDK